MARRLKPAAPALALAITLLTAGIAVAASSPTVSTGSVSAVGHSVATLGGSVNPGGNATYYRFQYGLTSAYGVYAPVQSAGRGTTPASVSTRIGGLLPGTTYHYRLEALNRGGAAYGGDRTFRTTGNPPPVAGTGPARVTGSTVTVLTGVINPQHQTTTYYFQYRPVGAPAAFYAQTPAAHVSGAGPAIVSTAIFGLTPGTTFQYRLVAAHSGSVARYGAYQTFITFPSPRPAPHVSAGTRPGVAHRRPYAFTTFGHVRGLHGFPNSVACFQDVTVRFVLGHRQVALAFATVMPDCTFRTAVRFHHLPGTGPPGRRIRLRLLIHFRGNSYLRPANARTELVTLG